MIKLSSNIDTYVGTFTFVEPNTPNKVGPFVFNHNRGKMPISATVWAQTVGDDADQWYQRPDWYLHPNGNAMGCEIRSIHPTGLTHITLNIYPHTLNGLSRNGKLILTFA